MNEILTYTTIFFGYLFIVWLAHDQLFPYLENFKKFLRKSINDLSNESKKFSNSGYESYQNIINKPIDEQNYSKHRNTFIFITVVSFLLVSQNIVALTRVFETVPTLNQSIIDNVGLISSLTYGAFMAFGIVLTEFITGWTLFQRQEAQIEDGSKNFLHGPILVGISLIGVVFLIGETIVWYQLSDAVISNPDFINPFENSLFNIFGAGFIASIGCAVTLLEIILGYYGARAQSKFKGFNLASSFASTGKHFQAFLYYTLSLIVYIITLLLKIVPAIINIFVKVVEFISLPAYFIYKRFKK